MTLRTKLLWTQLPLLLALLLIGCLGVITVADLGEHSNDILHDNFRDVIALQRMKESVNNLDSASLFQLLGEQVQADQLEMNFQHLFETEFGIVSSNPLEQSEPETVRTLYQHWLTYRDHLHQMENTSDRDQAKTFYFTIVYPDFLQVKKSLDTALAINETAITNKSQSVHELSHWLSGFIIASTLLAIGSAALISFILINRLLRPLSILTQAAHRLGSGDADARARVEGSDEIALLAREFNDMADHLDHFRKSSLGELQQAQQTSQAAIDSLPDPVLVFGTEGHIITVNAAGYFLLPPADSLPEERFSSEVSRELSTTIDTVLRHVLAGKGAWQASSFSEAVSVTSAEGAQWFLPRAQPLLGNEGIIGVTVLLQDVTRMRRFEELRNDLVSTVAHEFRTPLTSLHMAVHLCLDETVGVLNEAQSDLLHAAHEDCQRLQNMVNDLLDISRIQSGRANIKRQPILCHRLLEAVIERHASMAKGKQIQLILRPHDHHDLRVLADMERINLVFSNLLTNAIRHTPAGGRITLTVAKAENDALFQITDTGEGIAEPYLGRVFDKFFRVPGSASGGAGLGLSICREIVETHGGHIGVNSFPDQQGCQFWFTLNTL
ncbi:MAG: ATP-binding protein [Magnetococcus sp. DMHC-6]